MSIIQHIRDKYAAVVIGVIALSLIGFILMDARSGRNGSGGFSDDEAIGSVNGTKISYKEYKAQTDMAEEYYKSQGRPVDEDTRLQAGQQIWSQLTDGALIDDEVKTLGLALTDKQLSDEMFVNDPPQFLKQEFTNQQTGQFDANAARQALNNLRKSKNEEQKQMLENTYMRPYVENLLRKKYFTLLQQSTYVPKWMVQKQLADNNSITSFQYVTVPYSSIADSTIKISDDQITAYIKKHESMYKQEEATRSISYVTFDVRANGADSTTAYDAVNGLKSGFQNASDAGAFATNNQSDQPYTNSYVSADKLTGIYKDTMLKGGVGSIFGPYLENNAWNLAKIVDERTLPDSVKARHILVGTIDPQTQQPKLSDEQAKAKIDSIYAQVKAGGDFAALALQNSDDEGSKIKGGDLGYFGQGMMVPEFNDSSFMGKPGEYKIVKTQFGYHLINIQDQKGIKPSYKIAYLSRNIVPGQQTVNDEVNLANQFAASSRNLKDFDANADKNKYTKLSENNLKAMDFSIPGIGASRQLVKWVFDNDKGDVSEALQIGDHYVVAAITGVQDAGLASAAKARPEVEPLLRNLEKAKQISAKIGKPASLESVASSQKQVVQQADSVSFANPVIPAAGYEPKVVGWSFFKGGAGKVSEPISGSTGVYVIKPGAIATRAGAVNTEETKSQMENQLKQTLGYGAITALRKAAKIKDNRSKYL